MNEIRDILDTKTATLLRAAHLYAEQQHRYTTTRERYEDLGVAQQALFQAALDHHEVHERRRAEHDAAAGRLQLAAGLRELAELPGAELATEIGGGACSAWRAPGVDLDEGEG